MKLFGLLLLLALVATAALVYFNWHIFIVPNELWLGFTTVEVPLGLAMLGLLIIITALFLMNVVYLQSSALLERFHHSRELEADRKLADQAEASRVIELRNYIETELSKQTELNAELTSEVFARFDLIESNLHTIIEQAENSLAAYIGELEDRMEKQKNFSSNDD